MALLIQIIGAGWAVIGGLNLIGMPWAKWSNEGNSFGLTFGLMFNMLLFVIPGLVVYAVGTNIRKKQMASKEVEIQQRDKPSRDETIEQRLLNLKNLLEKGLISDSEYQQRRAEIIEML